MKWSRVASAPCSTQLTTNVMFIKRIFARFYNSLPDIGVWLGIGLFLVLFPALVIITLFFEVLFSKEHRKFKREYENYLKVHNGTKLFCYTNRKNIASELESNVLPYLPSSIEVVKMEGRKPITGLNEKYISYAFNNLKQVGFPNVMYMKDGMLTDISLKKEISNAISQRKAGELLSIVTSGLAELEIVEKKRNKSLNQIGVKNAPPG